MRALNRGRPALVLGLAWVLFGAGPIRAESSLPAPLREVRFDQHLNAQVPLDLAFRDEDDRPVRLRQYFGKRPVILVLAYFRCPRLCTYVLNGLIHSLWKVELTTGKDYEVVVVSFSPEEKPALAKAKKGFYVRYFTRPGAEESWHFLTGEEPQIKKLADAVGFTYMYLPDTGEYAHASGITLLTPGGKVARYLFGVDYNPTDLRLGLVEASENKIGSPVDQVLLFCFAYDPKYGKYSLAILRIVRVFGVLTILAIAGFFFVSWRRGQRRAREAGPAAAFDDKTWWPAGTRRG